MNAIDWNKPYGEVFGTDANIPKGARYEQGGRYFDHDGIALVGAAPTGTEPPAALADRTIQEIRDYAEAHDIPLPAGRVSKQTLINAIESHEQTGDQE